MNTSIFGLVAGGSLAPKLTAKNGRMFARFYVWVDDTTRWEDDGNGGKRRPRIQYQVVLPDDPSQHKVWYHLEAGRKVLCTGSLTHNPSIGKDGDNFKAYANPTLYVGAAGVQLLDQPFNITVNRVIKFLRNREWIDADLAQDLASKVDFYFSENNLLQPGEDIKDNPTKRKPPRIVDVDKETGF